MVAPLNYIEVEAQKKQAYNDRQKKISEEIKRGVIVNSIVKDSINGNQNDLLRDYIIPAESQNPTDMKQPAKPLSSGAPLTKLCLGSLGVLGSITGITQLVTLAAKKQFKKPNWDSLPDVGRNMNLNNESHFVTYMMVQNPQTKTVLGASAFFVFAATGFVLKNFADGFRDIWTKKQYAKADYQLQDNLIDVETSVFKGKNDIIRTMMQDTAKELHVSIKEKDLAQPKVSFKGENDGQKNTQPKGEKISPTMAVLGTVIGAIALGVLSFKNIQKTDRIIQQSHDDLHKQIADILDKTPENILENHKETLKDIFSVMHFKPEEVEDKLKKAKLPEKEIKEIVNSVKERTKTFTQAPSALGGYPGKVQYFTFIQDARGHFYNWMMNIGSKPLGILALSMSGVTAVGYAGEQAVCAVKDAEVKKMNNETELNLHKRLVNVELRNFKQKKDSYIRPLVTEYKRQAPIRSKEQLDSMAQNILYEIKNGPPFVYA